MRPPVVVAVVTAALAMVALAPPASAQAPSAEESFRVGRQLMAEGQFARACAAFEDSQRRDPKLATLLNLADCREKNRQLASAWRVFLQALEAGGSGDEAMVRVARERAEALEPLLSTLAVTVPEASRRPGLRIELDGVELEPGRWGIPFPVDGGEHALRATAPGALEARTSIRVLPARAREAVTFPDAPLIDAPAACVPRCRRGYTCQTGTCVLDGAQASTARRVETPRRPPRYEVGFAGNGGSLFTGKGPPNGSRSDGEYRGRHFAASGVRLLVRERGSLWLAIELAWTLIQETEVQGGTAYDDKATGVLLAAEQMRRIPLGATRWPMLIDREVSLDLSAGVYVIAPGGLDYGARAAARLSLFWLEVGPTVYYGVESGLGVGLGGGVKIAF